MTLAWSGAAAARGGGCEKGQGQEGFQTVREGKGKPALFADDMAAKYLD